MGTYENFPKIKAEEFPELISGPTVTILVGPSEKPFVLPQRLLVRHSGYFAICLTEPWNKAAEGTLTLPHIKVKTFEYFVSYIFSRTMPALRLITADYRHKNNTSTEIASPRREAGLMLDLAILGQYLDMPHLDKWVSNYFNENIVTATIAPVFDCKQFIQALRILPKSSPTREEIMCSVFLHFGRQKIEIKCEKDLYQWEYGQAFKEIKELPLEFMIFMMKVIGDHQGGLDELLSDSED
ncbi:hypothetical protein F5884DRAFT_240223 [Xylogone sp. PMI_703]|nr:hypothetical protein F5884DRAFT_240223 [Xylogone sp. PMI_703]